MQSDYLHQDMPDSGLSVNAPLQLNVSHTALPHQVPYCSKLVFYYNVPICVQISQGYSLLLVGDMTAKVEDEMIIGAVGTWGIPGVIGNENDVVNVYVRM